MGLTQSAAGPSVSRTARKSLDLVKKARLGIPRESAFSFAGDAQANSYLRICFTQDVTRAATKLAHEGHYGNLVVAYSKLGLRPRRIHIKCPVHFTSPRAMR
jgi:hypothetical protein